MAKDLLSDTSQPATNAARYFDENGIAQRLSISVRTLQRWRGTGEGPPYIRAGARRIIYDLAQVDAWAAARTFAHRAAELSTAA